jgi:DNA-binding SARP family transcriptional activator
LEFLVLGPLEVVDDTGSRLELGGSRQRGLLALLLLHANEVVSVDRLVDELWGAEPPATQANTLQQTVSRLRRALGPDRIETRPPGYLLRVKRGELDLERFEELVSEGDADALRDALALWRGEPLADFAYEAFAQGAIARLTELRLAALERRIDADLARGSPAGLVGEIEALVADHPLRERLRALQLTALYRAGRQVDALAAYQEARRLLGEELGLEPSEELQHLERQILNHDRALDLPGVADVHPPVATIAADALLEARKLVTILCCDLAPAGDLDPEDLRDLESRGSDLVTAAVERHGGTMVSSVGGGVTAVFGVPAVREDDALRAVRAAVEIRDAPTALGVQACIGVQSGEVIVGGTGPVAGVAVAVAKRLAEASVPGDILIGGLTLALVARAVDVEQAEPLLLRSGTSPVGAFRIVRMHEVMAPGRRTRFVGRERELALIRDAWNSVLEEQACRLMTVVGDAGIGKTRLSAEALAPLDARILRGRCLPYGDGITYWPVLEVVEQLDLAPQMGTSAAEVAWAFRKALEHAAAEQPLIVVFEDIQWGEDAFLDLVEQTSLLSAGAPILLLCIARPGLLDRRPAWPGAMRLEPLTDGDVERLLPRRLANPLRDKIVRASGGNALFVHEMLAVAGDADDELVVPFTLQAVLAARLDQLDADERAVLTYAAVEGETFHHGAIQALAPPEMQLAAHLAGLIREGLIRPGRPDLPGEDGYRFRHILIRDAAYATLPKARRGTLHAGLADWLFTAQPAWAADHPEILAYHYTTALDLGATEQTEGIEARALPFLILAGERAGDLDHASAISSFERALALGIDDPRERARVQLELGFLLDETGRRGESEAMLAVGMDAANGLHDRGLVTHALVRISHQRLVADPEVGGEEILVLADEAIETFTELEDSLGLARAERMRAMALSRLDRTTESYAALELALTHAADSGDQPTRRYVIGALCWLLCDGPAPVGNAIDRCWELLRSSGGDRVVETLVSRHLCQLLAMATRFDESRELLPKTGAVHDELNQLTQHGLSRDSLAEARELLGDRAGAEQELVALWELFRDARGGAPESRAVRAASLLALLYCDEERWDEAAACLAYGRELPEPTHFRPAVVLQLAAEARLAGHRGEHAEAVMRAQRAVRLAQRSDRLNLTARVWLALSQVYRDIGQIADADTAAAEALGLYETKGNIAAAEHLREAHYPAS